MKTFNVWLEGPTFELTEGDIWPDGDGPENPSAQDVIEEMKAYGPNFMVIRDWALDDSLKIIVDGEEY